MNTKIAIIGGGFGGVAAARALVSVGEDDFLILDEQADFGGVWRQNRYPGCGADMPSYLFSYRDRPFGVTDQACPTRDEVLRYLADVSEGAGLGGHVRFNSKVSEVQWDEATLTWRLSLSDGRKVVARFLIIATGTSGKPNYPDLDGLSAFAGRVTHTVEWDSGLSFEGQNVSLIGSGASAVQLLPHLAAQALSVTVFQRTPRWILPKLEWTSRGAGWQLYRALLDRHGWYRRIAGGLLETYVDHRAKQLMAFELNRSKRADVAQRRRMTASVKDASLAERVIPTSPFGCSRTLFSSEYFSALRAKNVKLVSNHVKSIEAKCVTDVEGCRYATDIIVLATGYRRFERSLVIRGPDFSSLYEKWAKNPEALFGMLPAAMPNLIHMSGPNSGILNASPRVLEIQASFVARIIARTSATAHGVFEASCAEVSAFTEGLRPRLAEAIWSASHCDAWYTAGTGHNAVMWPGSLAEYRKAVADYDVESLVFDSRIPRLEGSRRL